MSKNTRRQNRPRIINYRQGININVGIILFGIIFLYIVINIFVYISRDKVSFYEVIEGTSSQTANYSYANSLILRGETVYYADTSGYINFYARESSRVAADTTLYSIDTTGTITDLLSSEYDTDSSFSDDDLDAIQSVLSNFISNFDEMDYSTVYDFKSSLEGTIVESINNNALESIYESLGESSDSNMFQINEAGSAGIVEYTIDNYENFDYTTVSASNFDTTNYAKGGYSSGDLVESGNPVYKILSDEKWNIIIQLTDEDLAKYMPDEDGNATTVVKIKFLKDGITAKANIEVFEGSDGEYYGLLTLYNYMIRYASDRYIDIQIIEDQVSGLKIPKTSLATKEFYVIPVEYVVQGGDDGDYGFMLQTNNDSGETTSEFVEPEIFYADDNYYYIDTGAMNEGSVIIGNDTTETYTIGTTAELVGVYNINNGYTKFVQVNILAETDEYYIVESESDYGLIIYDHIILDSSTVSDNQVIFQ